MGLSVVQLPHYGRIINSHILHNASLLRWRMHIIGMKPAQSEESRLRGTLGWTPYHHIDPVSTNLALCICLLIHLWLRQSGLFLHYTRNYLKKEECAYLLKNKATNKKMSESVVSNKDQNSVFLYFLFDYGNDFWPHDKHFCHPQWCCIMMPMSKWNGTLLLQYIEVGSH